jgi:hypothetical protein
LEPVDTLTGGRPLVPLTVALQRRLGQDWVGTDIRPTTTPSGVVAYPKLGRTVSPFTAPVQRFRAVFEADGYLPLYRVTADGVEFDAYPYNDTNPPQQQAARTAVELAPSVTYPFPPEVPVLYGQVTTATGVRVADALVEAVVGNGGMPRPRTERTMTDRRGAFALPLRWARTDVDTTVVATFSRTGVPMVGAVAIRAPGGLRTSHTIQIA